MINSLKYVLLLLVFFQCKAQKEKIEEGEWVKITINKHDTIISKPCNSENRKIIIRKDSLIDFNGQEVIACKITTTFQKNNWKFVILEKNCSYSDTIKYKKINSKIVQWQLYKGINFYSVSSSKNTFRKVNEVCQDSQTTVSSIQKKDIFLYNFLKEGITKDNVIYEKSKSIIESVIGNYTTMDDYGTTDFYKREEAIITDYNITSEQEKIWHLCLEKLNFEDVIDQNELESDWRYPLNKLSFAQPLMSIYNDSHYGDAWNHISKTPKYHIALYMYFLQWNQRKKIYEEIDALKKRLSQKEHMS